MENIIVSCKKCKKEVPAESYYCMWCGAPVRKNPKKKMYQRPDGLYEKILTINHKRIAFRGKTEAEVNRKILNYHEAEEKGPLLSDVAWEWREEHFKNITYGTRQSYTKPFKRILEYFDGQYIKDIAPSEIDKFIKYLSLDQHLAYGTVCIPLSVLRMIFNYAVLNDILPYNPTESVTIPKGLKKTKRRAPTEQEIKVVKESIGKPFGLFYFFVLYTGCRRGEVLALQFKDIDYTNKVIHITKSLYFTSRTSELKGTKTESGKRDVPLLDVLRDKLPKGKPNEFLFGGKQPLSRARYVMAFKKYQKETGLEITPHNLRHGYATILYDAGIDIKTAQRLLGHANYQITMDTYTHISISRAQKDAEKLNEFTQTAQNNK